MQAAWIYKEQFNLSADAMVLLGAPAAVVDALHMATDVCWWFHVRSLVEQRYFYAFSSLSSDVFLDVPSPHHYQEARLQTTANVLAGICR